MSEFTEISGVEAITVKDSGHVEVKRADRILRDGIEISKTYHRHVLAPGDDLTKEDPQVQAIAKAAWKSLKPKGKE